MQGVEWGLVFEAIYKFAVLIGGGCGLLLAWRRVAAANRQAEAQIRQADAATLQSKLQQRKLATEIFSQAVGLLRDDKLEIRLCAVYTLRSLQEEFPDDRRAVFELLAEYLRNNPSRWGDAEPPADVQEIMRVLESSLERQP